MTIKINHARRPKGVRAVDCGARDRPHYTAIEDRMRIKGQRLRSSRWTMRSRDNSKLLPRFKLSFLSDLRQLDALPPTARFFTSYATSMYTNIDPYEGIPTLRRYFDEFGNECANENIPKELLLEVTALVMKTNVFQFGNTWWQQNVGTAMETKVNHL
jgi:hypothetical protein